LDLDAGARFRADSSAVDDGRALPGDSAGWVVAALALFVVVTLLGAVGGQPPKRARKLAARLAKEGDVESDELRSLLDDRLARTVNYLSAALLVAIVVLMVFKPGARGG